MITLTINSIQQALQGPLPGAMAQKKMAPAPHDSELSRWAIPATCRQAGVMLLLYPRRPAINGNGAGEELHLALIKRPDYPGVHSGQISFPGGRRENDEPLQTTALRETYEEIGIPAHQPQLIGRLSRLYTPPSNFCIDPFVSYLPHQPAFIPDTREVAEVIEAPLRLFLDATLQQEEIWYFEKYGERRVPFFNIFGHKVWGATAMILSEFLTLLQLS
jgi:8-oxo-dGTP pyrophosphatase MutT (NUDIX family)